MKAFISCSASLFILDNQPALYAVTIQTVFLMLNLHRMSRQTNTFASLESTAIIVLKAILHFGNKTRHNVTLVNNIGLQLIALKLLHHNIIPFRTFATQDSILHQNIILTCIKV